MKGPEVAAAVLIHLAVPLAGVAWYVSLWKRLRGQGASAVFLHQLLLIFFCWGGLLLVVLTALFGQWSGLASAGAAFLITLAPLSLAIVAVSLFRSEQRSPAQRTALRACLSYFAALLVLLTFMHFIPNR